MKLFEVCRHRGIPIITVINKWDRPGNDALDLMDEISDAHRPAAHPAELAGRHRRRLPRRAGRRHRATTCASPAPTAAPPWPPRSTWAPTRPPPSRATPSSRRRRRASCSVADRRRHDVDSFLAGQEHAGPVRLRGAELRRPLPAGHPGRPRAAARPRARTRDGAAARDRRAVQRLRVQGAGRHGRRPPRPAGVRAGLLRRLRAGHGRHPLHDQPARSPPSTPSRSSAASARASTGPSPATSSAWSTPTPCGSATACTSTSRSPSRRSRPSPRSTSPSCGPRTPAATSSSGAGSSSSTTRASSRCCARTSAATRRRCWPRSDRCSSRSPSTAWATSSAPR